MNSFQSSAAAVITSDNLSIGPVDTFETIEQLLRPLTEAQFFETYWDRAPVLISGRSPDIYRALLGDRTPEALVQAACVAQPDLIFLLKRAGSAHRLDTTRAAPRAAFLAYRAGATIRAKNIHYIAPKLWHLSRRLEQSLSAVVDINLYFSPPDAQTMPPLVDRHDMLVLQLAGRKRWRVYDTQIALPLQHVPPMRFETPDEARLRGDVLACVDSPVLGRTLIDTDLAPGDCMYLPRGAWHDADTSGEESVHLVVAIKALSQVDLIAAAAAAAAVHDKRLRVSLPVGFARTETPAEALALIRAALATLSEDLDLLTPDTLPQSYVGLSRSFFLLRQAASKFGSNAGAASTEIDEMTILEHVPDLYARVGAAGGKATLQFLNRRIEAPGRYLPTFRFLAAHCRLKPADMPADIEIGPRLALLRRLIADGMLRPV